MDDITPEVRQAVHDEDCAEHGHQVEFGSAFQYVRTEHGGMHLAGPDHNTLAHLTCRHCGAAWLIVETPGRGYADALEKFTALLADPADAAPAAAPSFIHSAHVQGRKPD